MADNKKLMMYAVVMLDKQDGMDAEEWDLLKAAISDSGDGRDIISNVTVMNKRAFLDETWAEENFHRFE